MVHDFNVQVKDIIVIVTISDCVCACMHACVWVCMCVYTCLIIMCFEKTIFIQSHYKQFVVACNINDKYLSISSKVNDCSIKVFWIIITKSVVLAIIALHLLYKLFSIRTDVDNHDGVH